MDASPNSTDDNGSEYANETFNLQLKFVPNHPSQNEDDIAEAILIGWAYIHPTERKKAFVAKSKE